MNFNPPIYQEYSFSYETISQPYRQLMSNLLPFRNAIEIANWETTIEAKVHENQGGSMRRLPFQSIRIISLLCILCTLLGCSHTPTCFSADPDNNGTPQKSRFFASMSDIHFDPFYDPTLVDQLIQSEYHNWKTIFSSSSKKGCGTYGADTNYPLLNSALHHAALVAHDAEFVVISGDFLSHHFNEDYYTYSGNENPTALHEFINKTIAFVTMMLTESFPKTPIYPVLGNNDSYCGDYRVQPNAEFLKATTKSWKLFFKDKNNTQAFLESFPAGGYYTVPLPHTSAHRLIALNTIFWSANYENACGNPQDDPGQKELQWLEVQLQQAAANSETVWLVYHIPPGIDTYSTINANFGGDLSKIISFWHPEYTNKFMELMAKYSSMVALSLVGHIHMDNFILVREKMTSNPLSFVHFTPSISPIFGNNSSFELITIDPDSHTFIDYETHYLDLGTASKTVTWKPEYRFSKAYNQPTISTQSLQSIYQRMQKGLGTDRKNYVQYYNVDNTASPKIDDKNWAAYWCSIGNITESQFLSCYNSFGDQ